MAWYDLTKHRSQITWNRIDSSAKTLIQYWFMEYLDLRYVHIFM